MSEDDNIGAPPLWRVASCSFKQASFAAQLWDEIHRARDVENALIRLYAQHHETLNTRQINKTEAIIKRYKKGDYSSEIAPLEPLLLTDLEALRSKLSLIGDGCVTGDISSQIAEGAALLYLSNCLSQTAIVAMAVRRECSWPMKKLPKPWYTAVNNMPALSSYCTKIAGAANLMATIRNIVRGSVQPAVTHSDLLSGGSRLVAINSVMHTINNRLWTASGYLDLMMKEIRKIMDGDTEGLKDFREILEEWEPIPDSIARLAISDDEPIIYLGKLYRGTELIADGTVPEYVKVANLNIIAGHFVNNAYAHPDPQRKLKVMALQAAHGIYVTDTGSGISLERLRAIESQVRAGKTVQTDHEGGTGNGLRDSMLLLEDLLAKVGVAAEGAKGRQAAITIASKEGVGTISSITWFQRTDESEVEIVPDGWNYIQFVVDIEEEMTVRRADSGNLPRPVSDMIVTHDSLLADAKTSA